jgi:hypothetical protein
MDHEYVEQVLALHLVGDFPNFNYMAILITVEGHKRRVNKMIQQRGEVVISRTELLRKRNTLGNNLDL